MKAGFKSALIFLGLVALLVEAFGPSRAAIREDVKGTGVAASAAQTEQTRTLFREKCARCHGADGRGQTVIGEMLEAPDFTDAAWWTREMSDARLKKSVTEGRGQMPAFGKKLTKQEIAALVAYVRRFNKQSAPASNR